MKFEVELAEKADRDLRNIFFYIAVDLSAPENAERQINRLWDAILSIDELPERYRRYELGIPSADNIVSACSFNSGSILAYTLADFAIITAPFIEIVFLFLCSLYYIVLI